MVIEITESAALTDPTDTRKILQSLHDAGFKIAIDDFGTGYSSLARLMDLPVDILKIDRSFVKDVHLDRYAGAMVRAMLQLAKSLGMQPLAEGIETAGGACVPASSRLPARTGLSILKTPTCLGAHGAPSPRHLTTLSRSRLNAS